MQAQSDSRPPPLVALIGVDGGATKIAAAVVRRVDDGAGPALELVGETSHVRVEVCPEFRPRPIEEQRGNAPIEDLEREAARRWVEATAEAVAQPARAAALERVLVGVALPGLKTADGRGVEVALNAPRCPAFADELEAALAQRGLVLEGPIARLASDGECAGWGELIGLGGGFRGLYQAYGVGSGTGVAEVLLVDGAITAFEALGVSKAWQLGFEPRLSIAALNRRYAQALGLQRELEPSELPERRVAADTDARALIEAVGLALGELVATRWRSLAELPGADAPRLLERVIVGQRLGRLLADPACGWILESAAHAGFRRALEQDRNPRQRGGFGLEARALSFQPSRLENACILGAAARALFDRHGPRAESWFGIERTRA